MHHSLIAEVMGRQRRRELASSVGSGAGKGVRNRGVNGGRPAREYRRGNTNGTAGRRETAAKRLCGGFIASGRPLEHSPLSRFVERA